MRLSDWPQMVGGPTGKSAPRLWAQRRRFGSIVFSSSRSKSPSMMSPASSGRRSVVGPNPRLGRPPVEPRPALGPVPGPARGPAPGGLLLVSGQGAPDASGPASGPAWRPIPGDKLTCTKPRDSAAWTICSAKRPRKGAMSMSPPTKSVMTPGVRRNAPEMSRRTPSTTGTTGALPALTDCPTLASVLRPCCLSNAVPTTAVSKMIASVGQMPIQPPSLMRSASSASGTAMNMSRRPNLIRSTSCLRYENPSGNAVLFGL